MRHLLTDNCVHHITLRCHDRKFLLNYACDRNKLLKRMWEAKQHYQVDIFNWIFTSNHIHILITAEQRQNISLFMQYTSGIFVSDYNKRKHHKGAFCEGRYRPTLIQTGKHLRRCLFYIDMNMVRAGVVNHPLEWKWSGSHELLNERKRYCLLSIEKLVNHLAIYDIEEFKSWYLATLEDDANRELSQRQAFWSRARAVGDFDFIHGCADSRDLSEKNVHKVEDNLYYLH